MGTMTDYTPPDPDTGVVCIVPMDGFWFASWSDAIEGSDEPRMKLSPEGLTREEAIAWAWEQPAARRLIHDGTDYVAIPRP